MLVLSRRAGQKLVIGDTVVVTVLPWRKGEPIRLGVEAPRSVRVLRQELAGRGEAGDGTKGGAK